MPRRTTLLSCCQAPALAFQTCHRPKQLPAAGFTGQGAAATVDETPPSSDNEEASAAVVPVAAEAAAAEAVRGSTPKEA